MRMRSPARSSWVVMVNSSAHAVGMETSSCAHAVCSFWIMYPVRNSAAVCRNPYRAGILYRGGPPWPARFESILDILLRKTPAARRILEEGRHSLTSGPDACSLIGNHHPFDI